MVAACVEDAEEVEESYVKLLENTEVEERVCLMMLLLHPVHGQLQHVIVMLPK